jgi:hypothetical protein
MAGERNTLFSRGKSLCVPHVFFRATLGSSVLVTAGVAIQVRIQDEILTFLYFYASVLVGLGF